MKFESEADLAAWARRAGRLWLFLDYDGTLAEFAPTPAHIEPDPGLTRLLQRLSSDPGKRLAVISGRKLDDIQALVPVPGVFLGGTYGLDIQAPSSRILHRGDAQAIRPVVERVKVRWQPLVAGQAGFFLEDKGLALALHARFASEAEAEQVLRLARQFAEADLPAEAFRLLAGHRFLEVAPALAHKGEAVSFLLHEFPWPGSRLVYLGDDDKDAAAFGTVHAHGGVAVWVAGESRRPWPADADFALQSPAAVRGWLERLVG